MRRFEEAIAISEYTLKLDPLDPAPYMELGIAYWHNGQKEKASELYMKGLELQPDLWNFNRLLSVYYLEKGINYQFIYDFIDDHYCEGLLEGDSVDLQKVRAGALADAGYFMAQMGHSDEAIRILNELTRRVDAGEEDISYKGMGFLYYVLGETETAVDFLELSYEAREPFMYFINVVPEFNDKELRSNPRFQALIKKLGFET
jgi:tetratricopeptide (TPR) repeat protein